MLQDKVALVTGGSRGIGRAIALRLAEEGADVVLTYLRKRSAAEEVVAAIEEMGRRAKAVKVNMGKEADLDALMLEVRAFGKLDIVIANAAAGVMESLMDVSYKHWEWTMGANARGFLALVQRAVPLLQEREDTRIIALSSPGSNRVINHYGLVGASKAALESLVRYLAVELAPRGIRVNAVSPGIVDTEAARALPGSEELLAMGNRYTPAGRNATPEDVANVVLLLSSNLAQMIVGQTIIVDGGYSLSLDFRPILR